MGCRPSRPEICAFHDAPNRFGGSRTYRGGVLVRTHDRRSTEPLTSLSRFSFDTGARLFAVRAVPIRQDSPRPLPPHRRDAMKLFPVQNAFPRQEMRCSSSGLSTGDRAPTHHITPEGAICPQVSLSGCLGPFRAVMQHLAIRSSTLCHLRLPSPRVASQ